MRMFPGAQSISPKILHRGFGAGMDVEFVVDGAQVIAEGVDADSQVAGDFFVEVALGKEGENFLFTRRQFFHV